MKSWTKAVIVSLALAMIALAVSFPACALNMQ
jgi:hypothetical protein